MIDSKKLPRAMQARLNSRCPEARHLLPGDRLVLENQFPGFQQ